MIRILRLVLILSGIFSIASGTAYGQRALPLASPTVLPTSRLSIGQAAYQQALYRQAAYQLGSSYQQALYQQAAYQQALYRQGGLPAGCFPTNIAATCWLPRDIFPPTMYAAARQESENAQRNQNHTEEDEEAFLKRREEYLRKKERDSKMIDEEAFLKRREDYLRNNQLDRNSRPIPQSTVITSGGEASKTMAQRGPNR